MRVARALRAKSVERDGGDRFLGVYIQYIRMWSHYRIVGLGDGFFVLPDDRRC